MTAPMVFSPSPWTLLLTPVVIATALLPLPVRAGDDSLRQSQQQLRQFPFKPDCDGNTQEMVACLWRQRNQDDATLGRLLGGPALLEPWRASRRRVCERAAARAAGGSIHPLVWLGCENALNTTLIDQIARPLGR